LGGSSPWREGGDQKRGNLGGAERKPGAPFPRDIEILGQVKVLVRLFSLERLIRFRGGAGGSGNYPAHPGKLGTGGPRAHAGPRGHSHSSKQRFLIFRISWGDCSKPARSVSQAGPGPGDRASTLRSLHEKQAPLVGGSLVPFIPPGPS